MDSRSGSVSLSRKAPRHQKQSRLTIRCPVTGRYPVIGLVRCPVTRNHIIKVMAGGFKCDDLSCKCHEAEKHYGNVLYESVFRIVCGIAHKFTRSLPDSLEDLTQICFERIIENLRKFKPELGEFTTWSWRVSENVLRQRYLLQHNKVKMFVSMADVEIGEPVVASPEITLLSQIDFDETVMELKTKYPRKSDILNVMFNKQAGELEYHSVAEVARMTGKEYNDVLRFVTTVVRPFFVSKRKSEVSSEYRKS